MPDDNGISQNNEFYLFWLHALLAVFGVKKNPEFIIRLRGTSVIGEFAFMDERRVLLKTQIILMDERR